MAQAGIYAPSAAIDADVTIRVNGIVREHVSMDWAGDTTAGLPDQVVSAGTGMRSRTGSIVWAQQSSVESEPPHPLRQSGGWPPREGDPVVIDASVIVDGIERSWRRFTGRLGRTTGSLTDGTLTSEITDTLADSLSTMVTVPPLIWSSRSELSSWTTVYRALEQAGLGHIPPPDTSTIAHFTGQGESTVTVGETVGPVESSQDRSYGLWARSMSLYPITATRSSRDILVLARGNLTWDSWVRVALSDGTSARLYVDTAGVLSLRVNGDLVWTGAWIGDDIPTLAFQLTATGIRVWTSRTTYSTVVSTVLSRTATVENVTGGLLSAVSVRYLESGAAGPGVVAAVPALPVAWLRSAVTLEQLRCTRGVENVTARSVVDAWSEATLASIWADEYGTPVVRPRDVLVTGAVARTVRVDERVFSGSWSIGDDQVRSRVMITGLQGVPQASAPGEYKLTAYQENSARTIEAPDVIERFIEAPNEVEWGPVDLTPSRWVSEASVRGTLPSNGTWIHAVTTVDVGGVEQEQWIWNLAQPGAYSMTVQRLGQRTLKITETVTPATGQTVYLKSPARRDDQQADWIRSAYRDVASPIIRAEWLSMWADYTVAGATSGPAWAPPLEHDAAWFLTPGDAQKVADALSAEVTKAMPTLSGVETLWDPTRQIGDVEEWIATDSTGAESWRAQVLIVGYSEAWDGNVPSQSVDVRVISWTDPTEGKTYDDLATAYATYAGMSTGTYQQVYDTLPNSL